MKSLHLICLAGMVCILFFASACKPSVKTTAPIKYSKTDPNVPILVFGIDEIAPDNYSDIAEIKVGEGGLTMRCKLDDVIEKAKEECRELGGKAIKITEIKKPDVRSTCYRITAFVLKGGDETYIKNLEERTGLNEKELIASWEYAGLDNIEGIYTKSSIEGSSTLKIAVKKKTDSEYKIIYLEGASGYYQNKWSEGDLKARLFITTTSNSFTAEWYMADKSINHKTSIAFNKKNMKVIFTSLGTKDIYEKVYPDE